MSEVVWPTLAIVDAAPLWMVKKFYTELPFPRTDEEKNIIERVSLRAEGCGLVDKDGKLKQ